MRTTAFATVGVLLLASLTGCANSSIQLPWNGNNASDASQATRTRAAGTTCGADNTGRATPERARQRAQRAVAASRKIAWATGVRAAAASGDVAVANNDSNSGRESGQSTQAATLAAPNGKWTIDRPETGGTELRAEAHGPRNGRSPAASQPAQKSDGSQTTTNVAASRGGTNRTGPSLRSINRSGKAARRDLDSLTWPVGIPEGNVPDRGQQSLVDPTLDAKVLELQRAKIRKRVAEKYGIDPPETDGAIAIPGTYVTEKITEFEDYEDLDTEQLDNQVAIVEPGDKVTVYAGDRTVASMDFPAGRSLPSELASVRPVRVIADGTTQLLLFWSESPEDKKAIRYKVGVLKAIGPFFGKVFEETVATRSSPEADLQKTGYLEFLRGADHCYLRWTPADEDGEPAGPKARILQWNRWEGIYRVPKPPPAAPDQRS